VTRTRKGARPGQNKSHNGKAAISGSAARVRAEARMTVLAAEPAPNPTTDPAGLTDSAELTLAVNPALPTADPAHDAATVTRPEPATEAIDDAGADDSWRPSSEYDDSWRTTSTYDDAWRSPSSYHDQPGDDRDLDRPAHDDLGRSIHDDLDRSVRDALDRDLEELDRELNDAEAREGVRRVGLAWGRVLRFARSLTWALPTGALGFALTGMWGVPDPAADRAGQSPGTWLVITLFSLVLALVGGVALTALLAATTGRRWAVVAILLMLSGTVFIVPVLGLIGVARPGVLGVASRIGPEVAAELEDRLFDGAVTRWLLVGGLLLLALGWLSLGCAVLVTGPLNRTDGFLVQLAVIVAAVGAYLSWQFLFVIAAMVMVAGGLGLAWSAWRIGPDGRMPDEDG
jgi:hypothetical protein